jgi:hypothetical protein
MLNGGNRCVGKCHCAELCSLGPLLRCRQWHIQSENGILPESSFAKTTENTARGKSAMTNFTAEMVFFTLLFTPIRQVYSISLNFSISCFFVCKCADIDHNSSPERVLSCKIVSAKWCFGYFPCRIWSISMFCDSAIIGTQ